MATNTSVITIEDDFTPDMNHNKLTSLIADDNNQSASSVNQGNTLPASTDRNEHFHDVGTLLTQLLILCKTLELSYEARYKTDYFPRGGKKADKPQSPRYVHTVDGEQEITIKFPPGYKIPKHLGNYYLEIALLTVPRANQYYWHVYKFQVHHTDITVPDENPHTILLTKEHFESGEVKVKLVVIKTKQDYLKPIQTLTLFDANTLPNWSVECKTIKNLEYVYELSSATVAFSIVYKNRNGEYTRFTNTTVMSDEITEKEKAKASDDITCPHCSCSFSIKEQRQAEKKRSVSASTMPKQKKRRSQSMKKK